MIRTLLQGMANVQSIPDYDIVTSTGFNFYIRCVAFIFLIL